MWLLLEYISNILFFVPIKTLLSYSQFSEDKTCNLSLETSISFRVKVTLPKDTFRFCENGGVVWNTILTACDYSFPLKHGHDNINALPVMELLDFDLGF